MKTITELLLAFLIVILFVIVVATITNQNIAEGFANLINFF